MSQFFSLFALSRFDSHPNDDNLFLWIFICYSHSQQRVTYISLFVLISRGNHACSSCFAYLNLHLTVRPIPNPTLHMVYNYASHKWSPTLSIIFNWKGTTSPHSALLAHSQFVINVFQSFWLSAVFWPVTPLLASPTPMPTPSPKPLDIRILRECHIDKL